MTGIALGDRPIAGKYYLLAELGRGGMADVYLAITEASPGGLTKLVVVKILRSALAEDEDVLKAFLDGSRLAARLNHPNVVQTTAFGEDQGHYFVATEYLEGQAYDRIVRRVGADGLPLSMRLHMLTHVLAGLHYAHELIDYDGTPLSVAHRDVSPSNIFITYDGQVKLLDFGIAKARDSYSEIRAGALRGKVGYMAPEQLDGAGTIDRRADIYAAGVVFWEMLTGVRMWKGIKLADAMSWVLSGQIPPPSAANSEVPAELERICMRALAHSPDERHPTAAALRADLDHYLAANPPRPTDHEIANLIGNVFADDRSRVRAAIEAQLEVSSAPVQKVPDLSEIAVSQLEVPSGSVSKVTAASEIPASQGPASTVPSQEGARSQAEALAPLPAPRRRVQNRWRPAGLASAGATMVVLTLIAGAGALARKGNQPEPASVSSAASLREVPASVRGITDAQVLVGMSAAFSGPARELGFRMKLGLDTAFEAINDEGGVNGRTLKLLALDDGYDGKRAGDNVAELIDNRAVFAIVGNVGTPTAQVALPYTIAKKTLFFGAFTGAKLLRQEPPDRYVFNYRASYEEETAKMIHYLVDAKRIALDAIVVFAQHDSYGDAGFAGVAKTLRKYGRADVDILRVDYERNTTEVDAAVSDVMRYHNAVERWGDAGAIRAKHRVRAIVMVATYKAAARFIQKIRDRRLDPMFLNVSFVGSNALGEELRELGATPGQGVIVTQVVPHYESGGTGVIRYRDALAKFHPDQEPDFVSLEGYFVGRLFAEGLRRCSRQCDTEKLVDAFEGIESLEIGTGVPLTFGPSQHQASHKVWGTVLDQQWHFTPLDMDD